MRLIHYRDFKITIISLLILSLAAGSFLTIRSVKRISKNSISQGTALEQIKNLMPLGEKALSFTQCNDSDLFLMPHHLIVRSVIEKMYQVIKIAAENNSPANKTNKATNNFFNEQTINIIPPQKNAFKKVIIVSPNHFSQGRENILPANEKEHGFTIHRDFVKNALLNKIPVENEIPIEGWMLRNTASSRELQTFAEKISKQNALVIFSVDFSHYLPGPISLTHDLLAKDIIESKNIDDISKLEIDSTASIELMLRLARLQNETIKILRNTNPSLESDIETFDNTTHLFGCSLKENPKLRKIKTTLYLTHEKGWYLGKTEEDRYISGYDEIIEPLKNTLSTENPAFTGNREKNTVQKKDTVQIEIFNENSTANKNPITLELNYLKNP